MDAWLRSISPATMVGSVSIGAGGAPCGGPAGTGSGSDGMKSPRSRTVSIASLVSGSDCPIISRRLARLVGDARPRVTSTNSRPAAACIGTRAVNCHMERPSGFIGSVIIC